MTQYRWRAIPEKTQSHWLEVVDPDGWRYAVVKWDGCIYYYRVFNVPLEQDGESFRSLSEAIGDDDVESLHICDIDEEIARLTALRAVAKRFFGEFGVDSTGNLDLVPELSAVTGSGIVIDAE